VVRFCAGRQPGDRSSNSNIEARELRPPIRESAGTGNAGSGPQVVIEKEEIQEKKFKINKRMKT